MSATRPATEFSIGIMARSASPSRSAAKVSSNDAQGRVAIAGWAPRQAMSELAPDTPWKAMMPAWLGEPIFACAQTRHLRAEERRARSARGVDAERHLVDDATSMRMPASSARSCSSRSRRSSGDGRQRDEAVERRAAIGIEPDMVVARPVAPRGGGAGEIERPETPGRHRRADRLDDVGSGRSSSADQMPASVAMSTAGSASGARAARIAAGSMVGRSPWTLTTMSAAALGSSRSSASWMRSEPFRVIGARHHRLPPPSRTARRSPARRSRPARDRFRPPPRGARHGRSSARRRCRRAACRAAGSRPCGRE